MLCLACCHALVAVQVRFVIGESFYHVGPEEAEEELQEGIHSYACIMYSPVPSIPSSCASSLLHDFALYDTPLLSRSLSWDTARSLKYE